MSFLEHLEELRRRLIRMFIAVAAAGGVCLLASSSILRFVTRPFGGDESAHLALLHPLEGFTTHLKLGLVAGLFIAAPFVLWQIWGFVAPGLYDREKRVILPVVAASTLMFYVGAAFGYGMLPYAMNYLKSFGGRDWVVSWSLGRYVDFSLQFMLAFAVTFEVPLVIYAAARLGLVTPQTLRRHRAYAVVAILVVAGILTPPDVLSQIILAVPLLVLYEIGILLAAAAVKRKSGEGG